MRLDHAAPILGQMVGMDVNEAGDDGLAREVDDPLRPPGVAFADAADPASRHQNRAALDDLFVVQGHDPGPGQRHCPLRDVARDPEPDRDGVGLARGDVIDQIAVPAHHLERRPVAPARVVAAFGR